MNIYENEIKIRDQRQSVRLQSCPDRPQDRDNYKVIFGSGALSAEMLLVRIIKNNRIFAYFRTSKVK